MSQKCEGFPTVLKTITRLIFAKLLDFSPKIVVVIIKKTTQNVPSRIYSAVS